MGWIIFAFVIIVTALEVLMGVLRGVKLSGIRLGFTLLGTLIAALLAKNLTLTVLMNIAASNGYEGETLTEVVSGFFTGTDMEALGTALAPHIAGLSLSVLIPVIFIPLFLLFKLFGLFLYLITKAILNSASGKTIAAGERMEKKAEEEAAGSTVKNRTKSEKRSLPAYSKVLGGVLGAVAGLLSCALITMPMFNVVTTINDSGLKDTLFAVLESNADDSSVAEAAGSTAVAQNKMLSDILTVLAYGDAVPVYADGSDDASFGGIKISTIRILLESTAASPAVKVMKYTGAGAVSNAILGAVSTVKSTDIGANDTKTESYNFSEALSGILEVAEPVTELAVAVVKGEEFSIDDLDCVVEFAEKLQDSGLLSEEDVLSVLNVGKKMITEIIYEELGLDADAAGELSDYTSLEEFKKDVEAIVEIGKVVASVAGDSGSGNSGTVSADAFSNIDVDALLDDPDKCREFVSSALSLSNGAEIISNLINEAVSEYTDGKYTDVVTPERINAVGRDRILEITDSLLKFTKYDTNSELTDEEKAEIGAAIDDVVSSGLVDREIGDSIKKEIGIDVE